MGKKDFKGERIPNGEMTVRQRRFCDEYLRTMNQTRAAINAGYSERSAYDTAYDLMKNPKIRRYIDTRLDELALGSDEVLARLTTHARASLDNFFNDRGEIDLTTPQARDHAHLLKKIKVTEHKNGNRTIEIELHDPQAALVHLGRYHKLFTDKHEHTGPDGGPIRIARELTDDELATIALGSGE